MSPALLADSLPLNHRSGKLQRTVNLAQTAFHLDICIAIFDSTDRAHGYCYFKMEFCADQKTGRLDLDSNPRTLGIAIHNSYCLSRAQLRSWKTDYLAEQRKGRTRQAEDSVRY